MNEDTPAGMRTLAHAVRTLRGVAGLTQEQLGKQIGYSRSQVNDVEHGRVWPHTTFATGCDAVFKTGTLVAGLHEQGREQRLPSWAAALVDAERDAAAIRAFQLVAIPGLLQTPDYARAMLNAGMVGIGNAGALQGRVEERLERQRILDGEKPPTYHLVLDEAALHRAVGSAEILRAQLENLAEAIQRQIVTVQVLPFAVGPYRAPSPMTILDLANGGQVVHLESVESQTTSNPRTIRECTNRFDMLRSQAASLAESARLIDARIKELGP